MDKHLTDFTVFFLNRKQKSLPKGGFGVIFRFFSTRISPRYSGAKVKEETKSNGLHLINSLNNLYF